ncbi:MAG: type IV toxin-antitoxin system AbiEi family antitoxin domain-containing protein [Lapillicoccus sp.]
MIDLPVALSTLGPVFRAADAAGAGLTRRVLARAVRLGDVRRVAPGYYVQTAVWGSASRRDRHLMLAQVASWQRPWAPISHHSAAAWHELPLPPNLPAWVAQTTDRKVDTAEHDAVSRLEQGALLPEEVLDVEGRLVTNPTRTVIDCFRELALGDAVAIADDAVRRRLTTLPLLVQMRHRQRGWPSIRQADGGLWLLDPARESWFESSSFVGLWAAGIPVPEHQVTVFDAQDRFVARTDGLWRSHGTVGEADGAGKYLGAYDADGASAQAAARTVVAERQREERMVDLGLQVARWAPTDTYDVRAAGVRAAFGRGDPGRFLGRFESHPSSRHDWREAVLCPAGRQRGRGRRPW